MSGDMSAGLPQINQATLQNAAVTAEKNHGSKNSGNLLIPICCSISTEQPN